MTLTTIDGLLGGAVQIEQPSKGYRAGLDAVLVAAAVPAGIGDDVLDFGTGVGAAALCLSCRVPGSRIVGVDADQTKIALASANLVRNGQANSCLVVAAEIPDLPFCRERFDHVVSNPPYFEPHRSRHAADPDKRRSNVESVPLPLWVDSALNHLKARGWLTIIHRSERLGDILSALDRMAGSITVFPVWSKPGSRSADKIIVRARKLGQSPLRLARGLTVHNACGGFSREAEAILRGGEAIAMES